MPHTRSDYLDALTANGLQLVRILDLCIRDLPEEYRLSAALREHLDLLFSLMILVQKEADVST